MCTLHNSTEVYRMGIGEYICMHCICHIYVVTYKITQSELVGKGSDVPFNTL